LHYLTIWNGVSISAGTTIAWLSLNCQNFILIIELKGCEFWYAASCTAKRKRSHQTFLQACW